MLQLLGSATAAVGNTRPWGLCARGKGNSYKARGADCVRRHGLDESHGGPSKGNKIGSGFDVKREDAFWGVFEATAAWLSCNPLLAGLGTCIDDYSTNSC